MKKVFSFFIYLLLTTPIISQASIVSEQVIIGFELPETILHDPSQDIYFVSNIGGKVFDKDDNGFISKVRPDGTIIDLKWIDGRRSDTVLHSPKGMAIRDQYLYVLDIDTVRVFSLKDGKPVNNIPIVGTKFLNDIVLSDNGFLYISESGVHFDGQSVKPTLTDAIYTLSRENHIKQWVSGSDLKQPNGLEALSKSNKGAIAVVTRGANQLYLLNSEGEKISSIDAPGKILDGLVRLENGEFIVSSWETGKLYRLKGNKNFVVEASLPVPAANIGYDYTRKTLLLPLLKNNSIVLMRLE